MQVNKSEILISVVIAARNTEAFIEEAIYSILHQTHKNIELIIVNDCSTDNTENVILSVKDSRIKYIKNDVNIGPGESRNVGLKEASGDFIAIMDSDDTAVPQRLEWQLKYLREHPEIDIFGGGIKQFGHKKNKELYFPQSPEFIKCWLLFNNCIHNPTVFFSRELLDAGVFSYNDFSFGEDYYLWYDLSRKGYIISNLNKIVLNYRLHEDQLTNQFLAERNSIINTRFAQRIEETFNLKINEGAFETICGFVHTRINLNRNEFDILKHFFTQLYMRNTETKTYNTAYFNAVLYFFFLRLGKYMYLEKKQPLKFLKYFSEVVYMLGLKSFYIFLQNNKGYR